MAKITGPLLSETAHGTVGKLLTFSKRKSGQQVRGYNKPRKIPSPKQRGQRRLTEFLVAQWQNMSDGNKAAWGTLAKASGLKIAGYHYFLREAQRDLYTHTGLCGYWHCNEIVGGQVLDLSGNGNHGTLLPSYPTNAPALIASEITKFGKALDYDAVDERVDLGAGAKLIIGLQDYTMIVWTNRRALGTMEFILRSGTGASDYWYLRFSTANKAEFRFHDSVQGGTGFGTQSALPLGLHMIAVRLDRDGNIGFVIDGKLNSDVAFSAFEDISMDPDENPSISYRTAGFNGGLDEVSFYNRYFSVAELATRYKFALQKVG